MSAPPRRDRRRRFVVRPAAVLRAAAHGAVAAGVAACAGDVRPANDPRPGAGTVVIAAPAEPDVLLPPLTVHPQSRLVTDQLFERLAELGPALNTVGDAGFSPRLARRWHWAADSLSIRFEVDPRARWHDGRPVRAEDVRFTWHLSADSTAGSLVAPQLAGLDSVTVADSLTAVFWFARRWPEQFFTAVHHLPVLPAHLLAGVPRADLAASAFARHPVGSGRFRFAAWTRGQRLELLADTAHYRGRPALDRVVLRPVQDAQAAVAAVLSGEADVVPTLRPEHLGPLAARPAVRTVPVPAMQYGFVQFNLRAPARAAAGGRAPGTPGRNAPPPHPVLGDAGVRRALAMAVDRAAVVRNVYDSLAVVALGPTSRALLGGDTLHVPQPPVDREGARRLLDALGWGDADGDGVREKDGVPLAFAVAVPASSTARQRLAVLLQDQWRQVGARVTVEQFDLATFLDRAGRGRFDALVNAWGVDPSPASLRPTWTAAGAGGGGSNFGGYANPAFDALVDSAVAAPTAVGRAAALRRAYALMAADAPAVWLYEPRNLAAVHRRVRVTGVRADAWWAGLADWSVAPGERIARDFAPALRTAGR